MIIASAASVVLDGARVLHDVTVTLDQPRIAVIGANGSGKSTFARLLGGLVQPDTGSAEVHGVDTRQVRALRRVVGLVFTNPDAQILMPTPIEDVALSLKNTGRSRAEVHAAAQAALERFGLAELADQPAYSLSGGQKQLLALASVLVREPTVVIADEPTTLLDLRNARRIGDLLIEGAVGEQVVIATHDLELALRCDVALRFADGRLVDVGEPSTVVDAYARDAR